MNISLKQLHYFRALTIERNFGRAAARVHISQPALSAQIRELETNLGAQLVERRPREIVVTPAGREVLRRAETILAEVNELEVMARRQQGLSGPMRVGVIPTVAPYLLPVALPMLRGENSAPALQFHEAQTNVILRELAEGELDAAIVALPVPEAEFIAEPLFADKFVLAGATEQMAELGARADALRPTQVDASRLLLLDEGHCLADQALEVCSLERSDISLNLGATSLTTLCGLVAEGFGYTFLPEISLKTELRAASGLSVLRFGAPEPARTIGIVRRRNSSADHQFNALKKHFEMAGAALLTYAQGELPLCGPNRVVTDQRKLVMKTQRRSAYDTSRSENSVRTPP